MWTLFDLHQARGTYGLQRGDGERDGRESEQAVNQPAPDETAWRARLVSIHGIRSSKLIGLAK